MDVKWGSKDKMEFRRKSKNELETVLILYYFEVFNFVDVGDL